MSTYLSQNWQRALADAITDPLTLCQKLALDPQQFFALYEGASQFSLRVPHSFVARMQKGNLRDPLLLQVLPLNKERVTVDGYHADPLQEKNANPIPGLLHKYHGRVLLIVTGACAIHCRYCFRQEFPYQKNLLGNPGLKKVLDYISADQSIEEVILSGGDPLIIKDNVLANFIQALAEIPHVKTVRIHSRIPIVLPERITSDLLSSLTGTRLRAIMIIHCNHPNEIDESIQRVLGLIRESGIILMNQSVLLKDINDDIEVLVELSRRLFQAGVLPYYLHLLDPIQGAAHFAVSLEEGKTLLTQMRNRLPGYLVPKLVKEIPGEAAKVGFV